MIGVIILACASQEYVLPQAEVFEEDWAGSLSFVSYQGDDELCTMHYSLEGQNNECDDCFWEVSFVLEPLSDPCVYSDLLSLRFRVDTDYRWLVREKNGWEEWGDVSYEEGIWSFVSTFRFFP